MELIIVIVLYNKNYFKHVYSKYFINCILYELKIIIN